jgi:hypothetical protein
LVTTRRESLTCETTLRLATPAAIQNVLSILGIGWEPSVVGNRNQIMALTNEPGLYIWVVSQNGVPPLDAGGIYCGIGAGEEGGLRGRLLTEHDLVAKRDGTSKPAFHGHGIAAQRTDAIVVAGVVGWAAVPDLSWIRKDDNRTGLGAWWWNPHDWVAQWDDTIRRRLSSRQDEAVAIAEKIAIRAAVYLGDVGFAVNSKLAGAWGATYGPNDKGWEDGAAWAAVTKLVGQAAGLPDPQDDPDVPQAIKERLGEPVDESIG